MTDDQEIQHAVKLKDRGHEIRRAREAQGLSQAELASKANTSQQTVDRIERGAVEFSRAYPAIRAALALDVRGYDTWPYTEEETERGFVAPKVQEAREMTAIEKVLDDGKIPVLSNRGGTFHLVDVIPKAFPFEFATGVNAILITSGEMEPVLKIGDIAVINPGISPRIGDEVAFGRDGLGFVRTLVEETDTHWILKTWNPEKSEQVAKGGKINHPDVVVAKYSRNR